MDYDKDPLLSCKGEYMEAYNQEEMPDLPSHWNNKISSLVVREGCTLDAYEHSNYHGGNKYFTELHPNLNDEMIHFQDWNDEITSFLCDCDFQPVTCTATDEWHLVVACNNEDSSASAICTYKESHGIEIGASITGGMHMTDTINISLGGEILRRFIEGEFEGTLETGFDWSVSDEFTISQTEEVDATIKVEPGMHIGVYRVEGNCDDTNIKSQCYKFVDMYTKEIIRIDC